MQVTFSHQNDFLSEKLTRFIYKSAFSWWKWGIRLSKPGHPSVFMRISYMFPPINQQYNLMRSFCYNDLIVSKFNITILHVMDGEVKSGKSYEGGVLATIHKFKWKNFSPISAKIQWLQQEHRSVGHAVVATTCEHNASRDGRCFRVWLSWYGHPIKLLANSNNRWLLNGALLPGEIECSLASIKSSIGLQSGFHTARLHTLTRQRMVISGHRYLWTILFIDLTRGLIATDGQKYRTYFSYVVYTCTNRLRSAGFTIFCIACLIF